MAHMLAELEKLADRRCATCKHWNKKPPRWWSTGQVPEGLGHCTRAMVLWDACDWDGDNLTRKLKPEFAGRRFFAQDGSDYRADVITAGTFFCADWERR